MTGRRLPFLATIAALVIAACQSQASPSPTIGPTLVPGGVATLEPEPTAVADAGEQPPVFNDVLDQVTSVVLLADGRIVVGGAVGGRAAVAYQEQGRWVAVGVQGPVVSSLASTGGLGLKAATCQPSGAAGLCTAMVASSKDGGAAWTLAPGPPIVAAPDRPSGFALSFGDATHGWAFAPDAGSGAAQLFVTNDGGTTWQRAADPCQGWDLKAIARASETAGWVGCGDLAGAGEEPKSVRLTGDGGRAWLTMARTDPVSNVNVGTISISGYLTGLAGIPDGHVWSWYGRGDLEGSIDGGQTWTSLGIGSMDVAEVVSASLIDAEHGVALVSDADSNSTILVQTGDGGRSWQLVTRFPRG